MAVVMTLQELRDYIRFMPDDEILSVTIEYREEDHDGEEGTASKEV